MLLYILIFVYLLGGLTVMTYEREAPVWLLAVNTSSAVGAAVVATFSYDSTAMALAWGIVVGLNAAVLLERLRQFRDTRGADEV